MFGLTALYDNLPNLKALFVMESSNLHYFAKSEYKIAFEVLRSCWREFHLAAFEEARGEDLNPKHFLHVEAKKPNAASQSFVGKNCLQSKDGNLFRDAYFIVYDVVDHRLTFSP